VTVALHVARLTVPSSRSPLAPFPAHEEGAMYCVTYDIAAPIEFYERISEEVDRRQQGTPATGLLAHIGMPTPTGFRIVEVWENKESSDRFGQEIVWPAIQAVAGDVAETARDISEFEVRRLILGAALVPSARSADAVATEYIG
jgi:hypothetical protein